MNVKKLKRLNYTRNALKSYLNYMKPGVYVPLENMRTYVLWQMNNKETVIGYHFGNNIKMKLIRLVYRVIKHSFGQKDADIQGTVFYVNNNIPNPKRIKIFDYDKHVVLVKYLDEATYQNEVDLYSLIGMHFGLPKIIKTNSEECILYEELLEHSSLCNSNDTIKEMMFYQVLDMYCGFLAQYNLLTEEKQHDNYPIVVQHNDLSTLNIILDKNQECHIIDWEHYGKNIFFYDIFRWIINEAQQEKNVYLLKNYLIGKYDEQLKKLFSAVHCEFVEKKRVEYLDITYTKMIDIGMQTINDLEMWKKMREDFEKILLDLM